MLITGKALLPTGWGITIPDGFLRCNSRRYEGQGLQALLVSRFRLHVEICTFVEIVRAVSPRDRFLKSDDLDGRGGV